MTRALVLDRELRTRRTLDFGGTPNRARVSPSGRMVSWTVFVSGDSYTGAWQARTLRTNVECPSLSPGDDRIVFKKRVGASADRGGFTSWT